MPLKRNLIALELRHVEINISPCARIVQLAKSQSDYSFFDPRDSLLGQPFKSRSAKAGKFKRALLQNEEPWRAKTL